MNWDRVFSTTSWLLVFLLLLSSLSLWTFAPPSPLGPVVTATSLFIATVIYSTIYAGQALALAYAKLRKRKTLRKHLLLFIYLFSFFTTVLAIGLSRGFDVRLIDNFLVVIISAGCWLYWKFKTEYIDPKEFEKELAELSKE